MQGLSAGRVVHFAAINNKHYGARISEVEDAEKGIVTLHVDITPRHPDYKKYPYPQPVICVEHVPYNEHSTALSTWHWPEKA